ncbi:MAG: hypothetical protein RLZZ123_2774, partial [Pseudomonadota bacterium]
RRLDKLRDNIAALVMQLERPHQYEDAVRLLVRLKELLQADHGLRKDISTWYLAVVGDSSIVAPLLDEFVNPKGTAVTLAEKFEKHERRKLDRVRAEGIKIGKREGISMGKREGISLGKREGLAIGERKGISKTLLTLLRLRFGRIPKGIQQKLSDATEAQIKHWVTRLLNAPTLDDVFQPRH